MNCVNFPGYTPDCEINIQIGFGPWISARIVWSSHEKPADPSALQPSYGKEGID